MHTGTVAEVGSVVPWAAVGTDMLAASRTKSAANGVVKNRLDRRDLKGWDSLSMQECWNNYKYLLQGTPADDPRVRHVTYLLYSLAAADRIAVASIAAAHTATPTRKVLVLHSTRTFLLVKIYRT